MCSGQREGGMSRTSWRRYRQMDRRSEAKSVGSKKMVALLRHRSGTQ